MVSVLDAKTGWPHPTSASTLFLLFQAASKRLIAPLTLHKDPLIQPSSLLSSRPYLFSCLVAAVIISGGWCVSGVLRMLTAAVRKAEKGGKWEKLQRGHFEECGRGKKQGMRGCLFWTKDDERTTWRCPLRVRIFFSFHLLLESFFFSFFFGKVLTFTFPLFQGWEEKWECGDRVCASH